MATKPWDQNWTKIGDIGKGGMGLTVKVQSVDGRIGVLKTLHQPKDRERRARMHREGEALRTLDNPGITRLLDSNTAAFQGSDTLFLVQEYIDGPTVEKYIQVNGVLSYTEAVRLARRVVEIVAYCHEQNIGHRDIKPDNVMLRGGSLEDPVLIDFGLTFNANDEPPTTSTESEQQVGNRFLALPELHTPGSQKREPRSDLAYCCGLLYFLLSGNRPMTMRDERNLAPHERRDFQSILDEIPSRARTHLRILFGKGFMQQLRHRFQNAQELLRALDDVLLVPSWSKGAHNIIRESIERAQLQAQQNAADRQNEVDSIEAILTSFLAPVRLAVSEYVKELAGAGVPIRELTRTQTQWGVVARDLAQGESPDIFRYECKTIGIRGFVVFLQCGMSTSRQSEATFNLVLRCLPYSRPSHEANYVLAPDGRWVLLPDRAVDGTHVEHLVRTWLEDAEFWERPDND